VDGAAAALLNWARSADGASTLPILFAHFASHAAAFRAHMGSLFDALVQYSRAAFDAWRVSIREDAGVSFASAAASVPLISTLAIFWVDGRSFPSTFKSVGRNVKIQRSHTSSLSSSSSSS
jgi:hypothetical protein